MRPSPTSPTFMIAFPSSSSSSVAMRGLDPRIHDDVLRHKPYDLHSSDLILDCRIKPGNDAECGATPRQSSNAANSRAPNSFLSRGEMAVTLRRRHHQEAVALLDDALDVAGLDVRVADHDVVLLAGVDDAPHPLAQLGMVVLARNAELLAEIAFAD